MKTVDKALMKLVCNHTTNKISDVQAAHIETNLGRFGGKCMPLLTKRSCRKLFHKAKFCHTWNRFFIVEGMLYSSLKLSRNVNSVNGWKAFGL